jgi:hypothetical protein
VRTITTALTILLLAGSGSITRIAAAEVDACKYVVVTDLADDKYGLMNELRSQARTRGFIVVTAQSEVPEVDVFRSCVMVGHWLDGPWFGQLAIQVFDAVSGAPIAAANISSTNWWGIGRTVRASVAEIYRQWGFTGFKEDVYQARIQRLYPPRPTFPITEAEVRERTSRDAVEGIWSDRGDQYRLAIVAAPGAPGGTQADYIAVVLRSNAPLWQTGEIKIEFRRTESPTVFASTYFMLNKQPLATTFTLESDGLLRASIRTPAGDSQVSLLRMWPPVAPGGAP